MSSAFHLIILVLCFGALPLSAQHYRSELLKSIAIGLPQGALPVDDQQIVLNKQRFKLHVTSANDTITHIGIKLFHKLPGEYRKAAFFTERIMLELLLARDPQDIQRIIGKNNCTLYYNQVDYVNGPFWDLNKGVSLAYGSMEYSIVRDSLEFTARWTTAPNTFSIRFPANAQIILGMDKKELDEAFINDLLSVKTDRRQAIPTLPQYTLNLEKKGDVYRTKGRQLFIPEMNDSRYYLQNEDGTYRTIFTPDYPAESLVNLFHQSTDTNNRIRLTIQHYQYGNTVKEYKIPLNRLYEYAQANGFEVYAGMESRKSENLAVTVLLYNKELNFINVLYVKTSAVKLFQASGGAMTAKLRTNIPMDNINDLFQRHYPKNHFK